MKAFSPSLFNAATVFSSAHPAEYDEHRLDGKLCQKVNFTCTPPVCMSVED